MGAIGRAVSFVTGVAADVFYRRRMLAGAVPDRGPVLLVANHPNGLIDPILVQQAAHRRVRMLAKAPLFSMPGISLLVRAVDCLPVYRAKDGADTKQNAETFRAVEDALVAGDCVLIFPEGISHDEPQLQPLKTGAARMALGALARGARDLVVVPVGLTYADKLRYRSTAAIEVGPPLRVADFVADGVDEEALRSAARALTSAVRDALRVVTLNVEHWEDVRLLDAVDAIWRQEDPERTRRIKKLADGVQQLRSRAPEALEDVRARLSAWVDALTTAGLTPRDVAGDSLAAAPPTRRLAVVLRQLAAALFALPLAAAGAVFWAAPFWGVHAIWRAMKPERDVGATVKLLAGLVLFPAWLLASTSALSVWAAPSWALAVAVVAPGAGLTTRHYLRRRAFALRALWAALRMRLGGRALAELLQERDALCTAFDALAALIDDASEKASGGNRERGGVV
jgi:1-acyl-sn-glycerol-3-phosphate acyltransferase